MERYNLVGSSNTNQIGRLLGLALSTGARLGRATGRMHTLSWLPSLCDLVDRHSSRYAVKDTEGVVAGARQDLG
jgi:hypothetical protein